MIKRNTHFHGEIGQYNTVWNTLVRTLGEQKAMRIKSSNPELYKSLALHVNTAANSSYRNQGLNVRHPNWKVPSFYGMKEELKEKLKKQKKHMVLAYESKWLEDIISEWLLTKNLINFTESKEEDLPF